MGSRKEWVQYAFGEPGRFKSTDVASRISIIEELGAIRTQVICRKMQFESNSKVGFAVNGMSIAK